MWFLYLLYVHQAALLEATITACTLVLDDDAHNVGALCDRGEVYLYHSRFDDALKDFQMAYSLNTNLKRVRDGLKKTQAKQTLKSGNYFVQWCTVCNWLLAIIYTLNQTLTHRSNIDTTVKH